MEGSVVPQGTVTAIPADIAMLLATARSHRPEARPAANFLLAWWHARACGAFDLQDLRQGGTAMADAVAGAFALIAQGFADPAELGLREPIKELIARWRAGCELGSTGTWQAPGLVRTPTLDDEEHAAMERLLEAATEASARQPIARSFLLSWLDARNHGGFDPQRVANADPQMVSDLQTIVRLIGRARCHGNATSYGPRLMALASQQIAAEPAAPHWLTRVRAAAGGDR